jgi:hypothetical protein
MKRLLLILTFLATFLLPLSCWGQFSNTAYHIRYGTTLPAACNPSTGDVFFKTSATIGAYQCLSTNAWTVFGGSAILNITSPDGSILIGGTASSPTLQVAQISDPGFSANQVLAGCAVEYVSALVFNVGVCSYTINGVQYATSSITPVTLAAADPSNPRIDLIIVNTSSVATRVTGTAAASPSAPTVDPATQLALTIVTVAAGATTPTAITTASIYEENTEWTSAVTANFNAASTSNPYRGTKDIEATTAVLTNAVTLTKPAAGTEVLTNWNTLVFYIRSKSTWPTGTGASAARSLAVYWRSGSTQVGNQVLIRSGLFGFDSSNTSGYQQISIPVSLFGTGGASVTNLRFEIVGNGGSTSIGFYLDAISLQGGFASPTLPTTLMNFKGAWASTTAYNANDVVTSGGLYYVALAANTNVAVTTTATWAPSVGANAVTSAKMAVVNTRRTSCMAIGANNAAAALANADLGPFSRYFFFPAASTVVEIEVAADDGTPNIIVGRSRAGSIVNLTSGALATAASGGIACSNTGGTTGLDGATTCSSTLQNTAINAGDWLTLVSGTAGGTAKEMTVCVTSVVN